MKAAASSILLLAAAAGTFASPLRGAQLKRQNLCFVDSVTSNPSNDDLSLAIGQWSADVDTVNSFLDNAASIINNSDELFSAAKDALDHANDEPCQFTTLKSNSDFLAGGLGAQFSCAATDLGNVFGQVLQNLQTIVDNPADVISAQTAVQNINVVRCCNVLPDLDILWTETETDGGFFGSVVAQPNRPDSCSNVDCSIVAGASQC